MKKINVDIPSCFDCNSKSEILCNLSKESKEFISTEKGDNFYKKGQVIFYEGNSTNGLYCINGGKVKLSKHGEEGKDQIVRFAKTGDILGYRSLLSSEAYHVTATAMDDCSICLIPKEKFNTLIGTDPRLCLEMMKLLSKDLKNAEQLLIDIAQKTVKGRICEALVMLKKVFDFEEDGQTLSVVLTRAEIADTAGTATETTIRTLSQLSADKLISLDGKKIKILDYKRLLAEAGIYD